MTLNFTLGRLDPVVYFQNSRGVIAMPPSTKYALIVRDKMQARGFELREAGTLAEIDDLQRRMQTQEYSQRQAELERDEHMGARIRKQVRDRLYARMVSSATTQYEKDFIAAYLQVREDKREVYRNRFLADQCYFEAREFDKNSHHIQEVVDRTPNSKDVECQKCHAARAMQGKDICLNCANRTVYA